MYDTVIEGVHEYHSTVIAGIEINNQKIAPPSKVVLNKDNIHVTQSALLKSYENDTGETNPYQDLRSYYGKFYSLMHDGIPKFATELNGAYVRTLSSSTTSTISFVPWSLTEIPRGSLNTKKSVSHLIHLISTICPVKENAYVSVLNHMSNQVAENSVISLSPPQYFKCCKLIHIDDKKIQLEIEDWSVCIMADGCATNIAASIQLTEYLGFLSPSIRCVVHAADGSVKRMTNSKTMNFLDLSEFIPTLKVILRHFQLSGKSTALLKEALEMMDMKTIHMMTYCPTRMSYLLTASTQIVNLLVPLSDVLATTNIREEERSLFMSPKGMILVHLLADLKKIFFKNYVKILDYHDGLIISSYQISISFAEKMKDFETKLTDNFVENLKEDIKGNSITEIKKKVSVHSINLNFTNKPS